MLTHRIYHDQGLVLVLFELGHAGGQFVLGDAHRADNVTGRIFLGRADIDHQALVGIDQGGELTVAQALPAPADFIDQQCSQQNDEDRHQDVVVCCELNQVSNHLGCSTR